MRWVRCFLLIVLVALAAVSLSPGCTRIVEDSTGVAVTEEEAGPFPADYEDVVRRWAVRELSRFSRIDEQSVTRPTPGFWERRGIGAGISHGWVTNAVFNGRDRVGMATGRVNYQLLLRDGEVTQSRYQP